MEFVFQTEETDNQQINKDSYSVSDGTSQERGKGGYRGVPGGGTGWVVNEGLAEKVTPEPKYKGSEVLSWLIPIPS